MIHGADLIRRAPRRQPSDGLRDYLMFDTAELARVAERLAEAGRQPPTPGDPGTLALAAVAWITVLDLAGFLAFRRRDL